MSVRTEAAVPFFGMASIFVDFQLQQHAKPRRAICFKGASGSFLKLRTSAT
jgi:hypothetical protein